MKRLKYMLFVIFAPERFVRASTERMATLQTRTQEGPPTEEQRATADSFARFQTRAIRRAILLGVGTTALTMLVGYLAGIALAHVLGPRKVAVYLLQAVGAAVILGATLSQIGRRLESLGGENLADEMNVFIFRVLYVVGTFLFVVSVSWDAT